MGDTEKVMMTFQVPLEMRTRFKRACGTLGTGMSQAIRDFMDTMIANDKPAEPSKTLAEVFSEPMPSTETPLQATAAPETADEF